MLYIIGSILLYLEKFMQILYCEYKFVQYIALCSVRYSLHNRQNSDYVKFLILIMSRFLINKLDFLWLYKPIFKFFIK